jgi:hypothetical protein
MKRLVPNLLTALSLLLCVAAAGLWVYSLRRNGEVGWASHDAAAGTHRMVGLRTVRGTLSVYCVRVERDATPITAADEFNHRFGRVTGPYAESSATTGPLPGVSGLGFGAVRHTTRLPAYLARRQVQAVVVPWCLLVGLFAARPLIRAAAFDRKRRRRAGHCPE